MKEAIRQVENGPWYSPAMTAFIKPLNDGESADAELGRTADAELGRMALSPLLLPKRGRGTAEANLCFEEQKAFLKAYTAALQNTDTAVDSIVTSQIRVYVASRAENEKPPYAKETLDYKYVTKNSNFKANYIAAFFSRSSAGYDCYKAYSTFAAALMKRLYSDEELEQKNEAALAQLGTLPAERYSEAAPAERAGMLFTDLLLLGVYGDAALKKEYKAVIDEILCMPEISAKEKVENATAKYLNELINLANDYESVCSVFDILDMFSAKKTDIDEMYDRLYIKIGNLRQDAHKEVINAAANENAEEEDKYKALRKKLDRVLEEIENAKQQLRGNR